MFDRSRKKKKISERFQRSEKPIIFFYFFFINITVFSLIARIICQQTPKEVVLGYRNNRLSYYYLFYIVQIKSDRTNRIRPDTFIQRRIIFIIYKGGRFGRVFSTGAPNL